MKWVILVILLSSLVFALDRHGLRSPELIEVRNSTYDVDIIKGDVVRFGSLSLLIDNIRNASLNYIIYPEKVFESLQLNSTASFIVDSFNFTIKLVAVNVFKVAAVQLSYEAVRKNLSEPIVIPATVVVQEPVVIVSEKSLDGWWVMLGVFVFGAVLFLLLRLLIIGRLFL